MSAVDGLGARDAAIAAKAPIGSLGGAWMSVPEEEQLGASLDFHDWQFYYLGRHGVLGDVDPDVVLAAAYIFPPEYLRQEWTVARSIMTPAEGLRHYLTLCHGWGRSVMGGWADAERLAELGQRVIDGSDVLGLPLFAGWRAVPVPDDAGARVAHVCQVLREHRGACHGVAMVALQMHPLTAILANPDSSRPEENASEYGWQPPFPEMSDADRALRVRVEELTDDLVAQAYEALDAAERAELVALLAAAHTHAFG
jgi:hypothetical protein